ncbi:MAG: ribonuclease BN/unknown domain fusion protein [Bacteroidota bacterium]|jgi:membrane protein|nr:ribonuclease BN/unknown domain fusion protein [Bacteroidota bacterium]
MELRHTRRLVKFKPAHSLVKGSRKLVFPGFEGQSLYVVSKFFFKAMKNGSVNMRATSLAFSFFLALFPSIIFLFTLIPYIPIDNFQLELFELLRSVMPKSAFEAAEETITDIIQKPRSGLLSFGFISALYFSTNGFNAMINAFNETYHTLETRKPFIQRLISLLMVFVTIIMITIAITLIILSEIGLHRLVHVDSVAYYLVLFGKWIVLFGLCFCLISFNYYVGPKRKKGWRFFSAGSMLATIFIGAASFAFAYYVNNFGKYNKLYGSIGTLIVIMMWIYINSLILLLGFDLNASIHTAKRNMEDHLRED